jgi:hypothetical protein
MNDIVLLFLKLSYLEALGRKLYGKLIFVKLPLKQKQCDKP